MSRIFKSDYVQMGAPKPVKSNIATIIKKPVEGKAEFQPEEINLEYEAKANSIIEDAKEMYLRIIDEANYEARGILDKAQGEAEEIYQSSAQKGYEEGYNVGYDAGLQEAQAIIASAVEVKKELDARRGELYSLAESEILNLVLDISKKVIGAELDQKPETILSIIKQGLEKCAFRSKLILKVSDFDFDYVVQNKSTIIRLAEGLSDIEIVSDLSLNKGGCIIETPSGEINSSAYVQMKEVEKAFLYVLCEGK